jgi:outer membrane biosynthesis protein TonB
MDINIRIDANERFCKALDNLANTLLSLAIVTEERATAHVSEAEPEPVAEPVTPTPSPAPAPAAPASAPVSAPAPTPAPAAAPASAPAPAPAPTPAAVPVATAPPAAAPLPTVPTSAQTYTQDQLALAASGLIDAGKLAELQQLLASFNVDSLARLPADQYGAFATKLREMGAKI